jgi:hypothetical protein
MDMHPTLTVVVYSLVGVLLLSVFTYMVLYTRGLHTKRDTLEEKGRLPVTIEEGIAISTLKKEHAHRTGTVT